MESVYLQITIIICLAAFLSIIFRIIKQPAIIAYILTGIILGPLGLFHSNQTHAIQSFSQLGITLLLFMLGLEFKFHELRSIGKSALIIASLQMWFTFFGGFFFGRLIGQDIISALFIGIAIAFSSTIIIVKFLSDKKDLSSLHGKLAIGITLMQDFFAVLTIIFLSGIKNIGHVNFSIFDVGFVLLKVILLFAAILFLSKYIFPKIMHYIAKSSESLFLFSLAWVFALTALVTWSPIGFSIEIGGFLAGLALANTPENFQIIARIKTLRDFFITIFFVGIGLQMSFSNLPAVIIPALVLSLFVLFGKSLITMGLMGVLGYRKRTSFFVSASLAQVSEFSLILIFLGSSLHLISSGALTILLVTGIITFSLSVYILQNINEIYRWVEKYLRFMELKHPYQEHALTHHASLADMKGHIVLVGGDHMGRGILEALDRAGEDVVVVDFNPDIIKKLRELKEMSIYGDITDPEIQERINLAHAKLVISTVPDVDDNLFLIKSMRHLNKRTKVIVMSLEVGDAESLYKAGADYVVLPHLAGGRHLAKLLKDLDAIETFRTKDQAYIK